MKGDRHGGLFGPEVMDLQLQEGGEHRREPMQETMVPKGGLEPPRVTPHAPQTCASTNSATSARPFILGLEASMSTGK